MPSSSASRRRRRRRKRKQANKNISTLTLTATSNNHSSPNVKLQGAAVSATHLNMEGSFNSTLQENNKVESLSEDKELVVPDGYISITREILDSSESVVDLLELIMLSSNNFTDATKSALDRLVRESEEPHEDMASKETLDTSISQSDENDKPVGATQALPKGAEKSGLPSIDEKVGELLDVQELSYQSVKESFQVQPLPNVPDAESNSATVQEENEVVLRSTENPTIVLVTQRRQYTSWRSSCGIFEILRRDDR